MRARVALVTAAVMLAPLATLGGRPAPAPAYPEVAVPAPVPPGLAADGDRPHPCTPYAGCDSLTLSRVAAGSQSP